MSLKLPSLKASTVDATNRRVIVATPKDIHAAGMKLRELGIPEPGGKSFTNKNEQTQHHWSSLLAFLGIVPGVALAMLLAKVFLYKNPLVLLAVVVSSIVVFWWLSEVIWFRLFTNHFVSALLSHDKCPSCLYTISGISQNTDQCRICPECGAVWKHESGRQ
jgi:hypothetical protein